MSGAITTPGCTMRASHLHSAHDAAKNVHMAPPCRAGVGRRRVAASIQTRHPRSIVVVRAGSVGETNQTESAEVGRRGVLAATIVAATTAGARDGGEQLTFLYPGTRPTDTAQPSSTQCDPITNDDSRAVWTDYR